jgi:2-polyprenyl-3-methyl-5-hydroxy-6-metoxy-1,4-benzoquinol methylase
MQHRQRVHDALPVPTHDESARQDFVASLRQYSARTVGAANYRLYKARIEPAFKAEHGRLPTNGEEIRPLMTSNPFYQFWSATQRNSQEMMWDSVIDTVERRRPELLEKVAEPQHRGSLSLHPEMDVPRYHSAYDIHLQPGGYHTEQAEEDVAAGAIYDLGVPLYALGAMGRENNSTGDTLVNFYRDAYPNAEPERVLDLGCAIGNSTVPWAKAYPDAEVHGIDVAAPCLRYGHMRANAIGVDVHLSQQNAEATDFPDNHFDVIASALLFHETSRSAVPRIFKECLRILKPGGVMIHFDGFNTVRLEPVIEFLSLWEVYNNNENFLATLKKMDILELCKATGFSSVSFKPSPYITDLPPRSDVKKTDKGYMTGSFGTVPLLVGVK